MQLAAGQHGLQHIARVHASFSRACADDGVQLIDEEDDLSVGFLHFFEDCLQTLLKLAAVLRARHQGAHVQREQALVLQAFGDIAPHDTLSKAFHDSCLADARLADQHRVVLCLTGQDTDHVPDLVVTADHRVQLLVPRPLHKIASVLVQRVIRRFRVVGGDALVAAHRGQSLQELLAGDAVIPEEFFHGPVRVPQHAEEQMLHGDIVISHGLCFILRACQDLVQVHRKVFLSRSAADLRQFSDQGIDLPCECLLLDPHFRHKIRDQGVLDFQQCCRQMLLVDLLVSVLQRDLLGQLHRFLRFLGKFTDIHAITSFLG